ncbi:MAG TPA: OmpA family protein [Spirochaetota bacterium]|nr:OmpA family protein [Spirochaetota bacterium]
MIKNDVGLALRIDALFTPFKYLSILVINRVDLFFSVNNVMPLFYGGGRLIVHPYLDWIGLYVEAGGEAYLLKGRNFNFDTGYFLWSVGIQFDIDVRGIKREFSDIMVKLEAGKNPKKEGTRKRVVLLDADNTDDNINTKNNNEIILVESDGGKTGTSSVENSDDIDNEREKEIKDDEKEIEEIMKKLRESKNKKISSGIDDLMEEEIEDNISDAQLDRLLNAKVGDVIPFDSILFYPDSEMLKNESYPVLNKISDILKKRTTIVIEIGGYSNSIGNYKEELQLSVNRAMKVADYLNKKGISYERIMAATGYSGLKSNDKPELNRKVIIKIIKS